MPTEHHHSLYTDGGSRGNPGPSAIGVVLLSPKGDKLEEFGKTIGHATNNQAEYAAILSGLELAQKHRALFLRCHLDSELVVKQLKREYRVKDKDLAPLFMRVWNASAHFKHIEFVHVPREKNRRADELVNEALDAADE